MSPQRIKVLRAKIGATQTDLGRMLNAHTVTVSKWETDRSVPDRWTRVVLRTIENNLQLDPARAEVAEAFIRDDLPIHALAVLLMPWTAKTRAR